MVILLAAACVGVGVLTAQTVWTLAKYPVDGPVLILCGAGIGLGILVAWSLLRRLQKGGSGFTLARGKGERTLGFLTGWWAAGAILHALVICTIDALRTWDDAVYDGVPWYHLVAPGVVLPLLLVLRVAGTLLTHRMRPKYDQAGPDPT